MTIPRRDLSSKEDRKYLRAIARDVLSFNSDDILENRVAWGLLDALAYINKLEAEIRAMRRQPATPAPSDASHGAESEDAR